MKRLLLGVTMVVAAAILGGCPIYPDAGNYIVCSSSECFDCPDPSLSGACVPWLCYTSSDCGNGYTCTDQGWCGPGSGADAGAAGCSCPDGYICKLSNGSVQCVAPGDAASVQHDSGSGGPTGGDARVSDVTAEATFDAAVDVAPGPAADASPDRFDGASAIMLCNADATCTGGAKCIDGRCTPPSELCADTTQCVVAGEACVNGVCVPRCSGATPCPGGYDCDYTRGVCQSSLTGCVTNGQCRPGAVCVEARCVAPCAPADTGPGCSAGQACVNGGCIPDERAQPIECLNDGETGALATACADSSHICVHGHCYLGCSADGGGCTDPATACKNVKIAPGTFMVCATASNLGSDCDPRTGVACASGLLCVDGYCR